MQRTNERVVENRSQRAAGTGHRTAKRRQMAGVATEDNEQGVKAENIDQRAEGRRAGGKG